MADDPNWGKDSFEKTAGEPLIEVDVYRGGVNGGAGPGTCCANIFLNGAQC